MAAAMANVDDRDSWKVHFADTMRGGQYLNNWRMAELHAKEAPDRVRELEAWGAVFDRTKDGRILQRNFGGHRYPRLAHVGDRTGLEMIRTLQDHGIHQGIKVYMEHTSPSCSSTAGASPARFGYDRERGYLRVFKAKAVVARHRRRRPRLQDHQQQLGVHRRRLRAGLRRGRRADGHGVHPVPPDRAWSGRRRCKGILVTEGVRGEGGVLRNKDGKRFMFDDIPDNYKAQTADSEEEGWKYTQGDKNSRRPPELLTRDHVARKIMNEVHERAAAARTAASSSTSPGSRSASPTAPSTSRRSSPACTTSSSSWPTSTSPRCRWRSARRPTTRWAASASTATRRCRRCRASSRRASARRACTAPTAWAATRCRTCWCSASAPASTPRSSRASAAPSTIDAGQIDAAARTALAPFERGAAGGDAEAPYKIQYELQDLMQDNVGIVRNEAEMKKALEGDPGAQAAGGEGRRRRQPRVQPGLAHGARPDEPAHLRRGDRHVRPRAQGEPRRPLPRGPPRQGSGFREVQPRGAQRARTGGPSCAARPITALRDDLKQVIEENK